MSSVVYVTMWSEWTIDSSYVWITPDDDDDEMFVCTCDHVGVTKMFNIILY